MRKNKILLGTAALLAVVSLCLGSCAKVSDKKENAIGGSLYFSFLETSSDADLNVSAHSALLMEASSGNVVWQKNADDRMAMASTTKIMTALVALENSDMDEIVTVPPEAVGIEGSSIYLFAGERITMEDLLYALLLSSANDAAAAIAIHIGESIEGFADMMNARAAELGLTDTHFVNPHGLYDEQHYTTARELAIIARKAMENEIFAEIVSTYKKTAALDGENGVRLFVNHNKLLHRYEGACGIKTGFTKKSGRCLVSAAERDGVSFICVTLNAPDDWHDHEKLFDLGFSLYECRVLCKRGEINVSLPIISGNSNAVTVTNAQELSVILPRGDERIERVIELPRFAFAPVCEGDELGKVIYKIDEHVVAECPLVATFNVNKANNKKSVIDWLLGR